MARRCSREQASQYVRDRPFSIEVVQLSVSASSAWRPQKSHVFTLSL